ncbi:hypothetical protein JXB37_03170 [candidate division WOR-3 bacterium]|nr:hypothetical protein [candidate division WOR-3 bacterium]
MFDKLFNLLVVVLIGGVVVIGSLAISRFCEEELAKMVPVVDPQAVEMYPEEMQAARATVRAGEMKGAQ